MRCQNCHRDLMADEPVYRVATGYKQIWRKRWNGDSVASICAQCATRSLDAAFFGDQCWRAPEPCRHCGRPVILNGRRRAPHFVVCGERCRKARHNTAQWEISPSERSCRACGATFAPTRINASYCSHACRQKAYRARRGEVTADSPASERACTVCGVTFVPRRIDAAYCSHTCRQRAYRTRQAARGAWQPDAPPGRTHGDLEPFDVRPVIQG
jgi:hypothetical protein